MGKSVKKYNPDKSKFRIFQIGFNKCATRTLYRFFVKNGINSEHYDRGQIAGSMFRHFKNKRPLLDIRYRDTVYFGDMESIHRVGPPLYVGPSLFKHLDREYPNSKFILNTRNREDWIHSRIAHDGGEYLKICSVNLGMTEPETVRHWKQEWDSFHQEVIDYFKDRPRDLLVFNISKDGDSPDKVIRFFRSELALSTKHWLVKGKTSDILSEKATDRQHELLDQTTVTEATDILSQLRLVCNRAESFVGDTNSNTDMIGTQQVGQLRQVMTHLESQLQKLTS